MSDLYDNNWHSMSDGGLRGVIGGFVQHHRLNQNKSQSDVAEAAGISRSTLSLLERGDNSSLNSLIQVLRVLDLLHVLDAFQVSNEISPIEYAKLKSKNKLRSRARKKKSKGEEESEW
ncbi:MAG: helix-turn-helix domain-containing protein [Fibrobacterales bacterium]